ncbi:MAG: hypothetical protein Q8N86_01795 [Atribacterota bacterium]|nr:hypothetical protein [Atribacterota bacterium]
MYKQILEELKEHMRFTAFGAATGIIMMIFLQKLPTKLSYNIFYTLHPLHVFLSALVTTSMYNLYKCGTGKEKCNLGVLIFVGYVGSVGIATLSDSVIPYLGEILLNLPHREIHLGFIEEWWLVNPLALFGIGIAYLKLSTKFPHFGHVLLSTWASLFHIIMALGHTLNWFTYIGIFIFLFLSVWIPCCASDIVFPLLFIKTPKK